MSKHLITCQNYFLQNLESANFRGVSIISNLTFGILGKDVKTQVRDLSRRRVVFASGAEGG